MTKGMENEKNKKIAVWKILCPLAAVCLTVFFLTQVSRVTERKNSAAKYHDFFAQEQDFDVLFFGTSHVLNAIFPMELWEDYGIVSYNFGGHANAIPTSYWTMMNALDYTSPKLVVIDCMGLERDSKRSGNFSFTHLSFDAFPLSITKIKTAWDIIGPKWLAKEQDATADDDDDETQEQEDEEETSESDPGMMELLWDFSVYHNRWDSLEGNDFNLDASPEKGAEMNLAWAEPSGIADVPEGECFEGDSVAIEYLDRMIDECRKRNIEVLLTFLPAPAAGEDDITAARRMEKIAEEKGVRCINFFEEDVIDIYTDGADKSSHLNPSGARKVTSYLGSYIRENYEIEDRRSDADFSFWNDDYTSYTAEKTNRFKDASDLKEFLVMMKDRHIKSVIRIDDPEKLKKSEYRLLLENLEIDADKIYEGVKYVYLPGNDGEPMYFNDRDEFSKTAEFEYPGEDENSEASDKPVCITVYDNINNELMCVRGF